LEIFVADCLTVRDTPEMGRGVFTLEALDANIIIEIAPVLVLSAQERAIVEQTRLNDYIFEWGLDRKQACVAWGYASMYNHRYLSNCEYYMDFDQSIIMIRTVREIQAGEELFINYNGDWNDQSPLWFPAK